MTQPVPAGEPFSPVAPPANTPRPDRNKATLGQRIAGALLILNAVFLLAQATLTPFLPDAGGPRPGMFLGSALLDIAIGITLLVGNRKLATLAIIRAALGLVVFTALYVMTDPLAAVFQVAASTGMLLLLIGDAKKARLLVGSIVFGLYLAVASASLLLVTAGKLPLAALVLKATGAIEPIPSKTVTGHAVRYSLKLPDDRWFVRKDSLAKKDNPLADRWLIRPDIDAHILVIAEHVPGAVVPLDPYTDEVLNNAKKASTKFSLKHRAAIEGRAEQARVARVTATVDKLDLEYMFGVYAAYDRGFQVVAFAPAKSFDKIAGDFEKMITSFELPPEVIDPPVPAEVEPAPVGHLIGVSFPYTLEAPSDRWHLRKADVVRKENPLIDRWMVRHEKDAHVFVVAEHAPGSVLPIEAYTDAVLQNLRERSSDLKVISREPMAWDPQHTRLMRLSSTIDGKAIEYWFAAIVAQDRGFQVAGFTAATLFPGMDKEIRQAVESFRLPPSPRKK
ncbi:MAG: hypothetical protein HY898_07470 [Deltaproteobacteria bacterium]|nr:hypothetical protein [Deltaproteobacteria bacterium]